MNLTRKRAPRCRHEGARRGACEGRPRALVPTPPVCSLAGPRSPVAGDNNGRRDEHDGGGMEAECKVACPGCAVVYSGGGGYCYSGAVDPVHGVPIARGPNEGRGLELHRNKLAACSGGRVSIDVTLLDPHGGLLQQFVEQVVCIIRAEHPLQSRGQMEEGGRR